MEDVKLSLNTSSDGGILQILKGELPCPLNRSPRTINGNINAPVEFFEKRFIPNIGNISSNGTNYNTDACYVVFDHSLGTISLIVDEGSNTQITVNGSFIVNPIFEKLKINKPDSPYESNNELYRALKFAGAIFKDKNAHTGLLSSLKNFTAKMSKTIAQKDDTRGNSSSSVDVEMDLPTLDFDVFVPIFSGQSKVDLRVMVEVQERNGKPVFFLTCLELPQLSQEYMEASFEEFKSHFEQIAVILK